MWFQKKETDLKTVTMTEWDQKILIREHLYWGLFKCPPVGQTETQTVPGRSQRKNNPSPFKPFLRDGTEGPRALRTYF